MKHRIWTLMLIAALLVPTMTASAFPQPTAPALPVQPNGAVEYLLRLPMPEAHLPAGTQPAAVHGHYLAALQRQWTETEGVLQALQERGVVKEYALLPRANAFRVIASEAALETLQQLGELSPAAKGIEALGQSFEARFDAAIKAAQAESTLIPQSPEPQPTPQAPQPPEPPQVRPPADYLVRLAVPADRATIAEQPHELTAYLEWLKQTGEVVEYEWLPAAYAFRLRARGDLSSLRHQPAVADVVLYSEQAAGEARVAPEKSRQTMMPPAAGLVAPAGIEAYTPTTPTIQAWLYSSEIYVYLGWFMITPVITLTNSAGTLKNHPGTTNWVYFEGGGRANLRDASWNLVLMEPGDTLYVHRAGEAPFSVNIVDLTARVDRDADTISGKAPANVASTDRNNPPVLWIEARGINHDAGIQQREGKYITTGTAGAYSTELTYANPTTGTLDLRPPDTDGSLIYTNAQGNRVALNYRAPEVQVQENGDYVSGYTANNATYTVTLKAGGGAIKGRFTGQANRSDGWFSGNLRDVFGNSVKSLAGDVVEMEASPTITVPVVLLTAQADPATDRVTGDAPANIQNTTSITLPNLYVQNYDYWSTQYVTTTAAGKYLADRVGNINSGTAGETRHYNVSGDQVYLNWVAPIVRVRGHAEGYQADNYVSGYAGVGNALVTLLLKRGGSTVATASRMSEANGFYEAWFTDAYGNPVNIQAGDAVEATCGGVITAVEVPTLTAIVNANTVSGIGPANVVTTTWGAPHSLYVYRNSWGLAHTLIVTTTITGAYSADFTQYGGIYPGSPGWVRYINPSGHYIYKDFRVPSSKPIVYVRGDNSRYVSENYVGGYVFSYCGGGAVTLKDGGGTVKAQNTSVSACNSFSVNFTDAYGNPVNIQAGDRVEAAFGGQTTVVNVPAFDVTSDPVNDRVTGITNAVVVTTTYGVTRTLAVWPTSDYDGDYGKHVLPVGSAFTAANPFYWYANPANTSNTLNWGPGAIGHLRYTDANNNHVYARFQAPNPTNPTVVYVRGDYWNSRYQSENYVSGYVPSSCGYGTVTLKDGGGTVKAQNTSVWACNSFSVNFTDASGNPVNIQAGDRVEAAFGGQTTVVNVPAFDVTSDPVNDRVTGITNAAVVTTTYGVTRTLAVWPTSSYDGDYGKHVLPVGSAFTAANPFYQNANPANGSNTLNWSPGAVGHLRYTDAGGNRVYARFGALRTQLEVWVYKDNNSVSGYVVQANAPVTVTLKSGATTRATAFGKSDQTGYFWVRLYDTNGNPAFIGEGDSVVVEASAPITIPVPRLTGQVNVETEVVSGEGPANALLNIIAAGTRQSVTTDGSGAYSAAFKGLRDIQPGNQIEVQYRNANGHTVYIVFYAGPKLFAQLNSPVAWGYAPAANIPMTLTLKTGATVKGAAVTRSGGDKWFWVYLYNSAGQRAIIAAGDRLEVDFGGGNVVALPIVGLTANVNADSDTIAGTGPASAALGVEVGNFRQTVTANASGNFTANASGIEDIAPGEQVLLRHVNADRNEVWLYAVAPVVYVRARGSGSTDYVADNYLSGYGSRYAVVELMLKRGGATVATRRLTTSGDGYYSTSLSDVLGLNANIQGGDQVVVAASAPFTIPVPAIQATVDAGTDTVSGAGPANADLGIYINSSNSNQTAHTDASGAFTTAFTSINPGDYAYIRYRNAVGHWIHARFSAVQTGMPAIYARWNWDTGIVCDHCVSGQAGKANAAVNLTLKRGGSVLARTSDISDNRGWFSAAFTDAAGKPIPILGGDVIEMNAGVPVTMTVADLTAQANRQSRVLYGNGPANANLYYWYRYPSSCCWSGTRAIGLDGHYYFDLGLSDGASGYVRYTNASGHQTHLGWAISYAWVREYGDSVGGYVARGVPVTVRLLGSGGTERGVATTTSSTENGYFWVGFRDAAGNALIIQPNDTAVVQASPAITVPVVPLSINADLASDRVTGTGPANKNLNISAGGCGRNVTAAADGSFTADVGDECDLRAGGWVGVYYWNDEGNEVYRGFNAPLVRVNAVNDIVDGYATPNAAVSLTLKRSGSTVAAANAASDMSGFFSAFFTDATVSQVDIRIGDTVEVTASPTASVPVVPLTANVNTLSDSVSGSGPASRALLVKAFAWTGNGWTSVSKTAYTDVSGNYTVSFSSELDLTDTSYAYVRYSDLNGNQTGYTTTPLRSPSEERARQDVQGQGAAVKQSAFSAANSGDLTPPIVYNGGGGMLVFASQNGSLVVTRPDGSVDVGGTRFVMDPAPSGVWKVQVRVWGSEGSQYAIAIGEAAYRLFLPLTLKAYAP